VVHVRLVGFLTLVFCVLDRGRLVPGVRHTVRGLLFTMRAVHGMLLFSRRGVCCVFLVNFWHGSAVRAMAFVPRVLSMLGIMLRRLFHWIPPSISRRPV
jgi:hypothetical protein